MTHALDPLALEHLCAVLYAQAYAPGVRMLPWIDMSPSARADIRSRVLLILNESSPRTEEETAVPAPTEEPRTFSVDGIHLSWDEAQKRVQELADLLKDPAKAVADTGPIYASAEQVREVVHWLTGK